MDRGLEHSRAAQCPRPQCWSEGWRSWSWPNWRDMRQRATQMHRDRGSSWCVNSCSADTDDAAIFQTGWPLGVTSALPRMSLSFRPASLQWTWKLEAAVGMPGCTLRNSHVSLCGPEYIYQNKYIVYAWFIIWCWSLNLITNLLHLNLFSINFTCGWKKIFFFFLTFPHMRDLDWNIELRGKKLESKLRSTPDCCPAQLYRWQWSSFPQRGTVKGLLSTRPATSQCWHFSQCVEGREGISLHTEVVVTSGALYW